VEVGMKSMNEIITNEDMINKDKIYVNAMTAVTTIISTILKSDYAFKQFSKLRKTYEMKELCLFHVSIVLSELDVFNLCVSEQQEYIRRFSCTSTINILNDDILFKKLEENRKKYVGSSKELTALLIEQLKWQIQMFNAMWTLSHGKIKSDIKHEV
jgi:hypothetical protein